MTLALQLPPLSLPLLPPVPTWCMVVGAGGAGGGVGRAGGAGGTGRVGRAGGVGGVDGSGTSTTVSGSGTDGSSSLSFSLRPSNVFVLVSARSNSSSSSHLFKKYLHVNI